MTRTIRALSCILTASAWLLLSGGAALARQPEEPPRVAGERGTEPYDVLLPVGSFALSRLTHDNKLDPEQRAEILEVGLQALDMAMAARRGSPAAPYLKAQLLREKARLTSDPAAREVLLDEIGDLEKLLADLQAAGQAPKSPQKR